MTLISLLILGLVLSLDNARLAVALEAFGLGWRRALRVALVFGLWDGLSPLAGLLIGLQRLLYRVMGDVAMPGEENFVGPSDVEYLDAALEEWRNKTELPNEFVVPGGSRLGALLDVARSVARRAERSLVAAGYVQDHPDAVRCVNRLSDVLFVAARNADGGHTLSKG